MPSRSRGRERELDREHDPDQRGHGPGEPTMPIRLVAEGVGAFVLTSVAAGADAAARITADEVSPLARALAPGLVVMALIYAMADRSGAHFNPVVTLAFTVRRLFPLAWVVPYWLAQLAGAVLAGLSLRLLFGAAADAGVSTPHLDLGAALALEVFLSFVRVTVILGTADRYQVIGPDAAIAVGATIALCGLVALPLEGASMNPARSLGPAIATGHVADVLLYVIGPLLGGALAVGLATFLHGPASAADHKPREAAQGKG